MRKFKKGDIVKAKKETNEYYLITNEINQFIGKVISYNRYDELIVRTIHANEYVKSREDYAVDEDCFELVYRSTVKEILDSTEKEYLRNVIKPFRDKVEYIKKGSFFDKWYIRIALKDECVNFPCLTNKNMYKNMELYKEYSLKELGL